MGTMQTLLLVFQVIVAVCLIGFILIQRGKGADAGTAFGSGASATVFGARGSGNFLTRTTTFLAILFLGNSLLLGYLSTQTIKQQGSLMDKEKSMVIQKEITEKPTPSQEIPDTPVSDIPTLPEQQP